MVVILFTGNPFNVNGSSHPYQLDKFNQILGLAGLFAPFQFHFN